VRTCILAVLTVVSPSAPGVHAATPPGDRFGPKVAVDRETHDFGKLDVGVTGVHEFVFTNGGNQPLTLTRKGSSCGCCTCVCTVRLPDGSIAPGESAPVTLEWKSKLYTGRFRQTVTILTNDPDRPEVKLSVTGRFAGPLGAVPSAVQFARVPPGRSASVEIRLYSYLEEPLEILGWEFSDAETAEFFEVAWERLAPEQLRGEPDARGGHLVRVTVHPGLARGAVQQQLVLKTNWKSILTVEIPIEGTIAGDVQIAGRGWDRQTGVLNMGTVKSREGATWRLVVVVRGPHAKDVKLEPVRVDPPLLRLELGQTVHVRDQALCHTRLTIRVPPGSPPVEHLGSERGEPGRIVLNTGHPQVPELSIQVRFAVKE